VSPADETRTEDKTPTFDWTDVTDPSGVTYTLEITGVLTERRLTSSTCTLTSGEALADGTYSWRVRAVDGSGNASAWSEVWTFTVVTRLMLISPADGTKTNDVTPTFEWSSVIGPVSYELEYARDNEFATGEVTKSGLTENSYTPLENEVLADDTWYWRVRSVDEEGIPSDWSATWSLIIDTTPPNSPEVDQLPKQTAIQTLLVSGTAEAGSVIKVYIDENLVGETTANADNSFQIIVTLAEGSNAITLVAIDDVGNASQASQVQTVTYVEYLRAEVSVDFIGAGQSHTFDFTEYNLTVLDVTLTVYNPVLNPSIAVEIVPRPEDLPLQPGIAYGHMYITTTVSAEDMESAEVLFRVEKSWIEQNDIDTDTVELLQFIDGEWQALPTSLVEEDNVHVYCSASTDVLDSAPFALAGEEVVVPPPVPIPLPTFLLVLGAFVSIAGIGGVAIYLSKFRPIPSWTSLKRLKVPRPTVSLERLKGAITPAISLGRLAPAPMTMAPALPVGPLEPVPIVTRPPPPPPRRVVPKAMASPEILEHLKRGPRPPAPRVSLEGLKRVVMPVAPAVTIEGLTRVSKQPAKLAIPMKRLERVVRPLEPSIPLKRLKEVGRHLLKPKAPPKRVPAARSEAPKSFLERLKEGFKKKKRGGRKG